MRSLWTLTEMKEIILSLLALLWGVLFLFPEDTLSRASRVDLMRIYAGDVTWGLLLIVVSLFLLLSPRHRHQRLRRAAHAFFWLFWLAISLLVLVRTAAGGVSLIDILLMSPYLALAFIHASFYARLVYVK